MRLARSLDQQFIRYVVIGGQAINQHGYARYTRDVDFELDLPPWEAARLGELAVKERMRERYPGAIDNAAVTCLLPMVDSQNNVVADMALSPGGYFDETWLRSKRLPVLGYEITFAAVEDLIIRKIIANRPRDREDIDQLLLRHEQRIDLTYIDQWLGRFEQVVEAPLRRRFGELLQASRR